MTFLQTEAAIAQLGERQTEDLKVPGSVPGLGIGNPFHGDEIIMEVRVAVREIRGQVAMAKTSDAKRCDKQ